MNWWEQSVILSRADDEGSPARPPAFVPQIRRFAQDDKRTIEEHAR
jgi:hypothetical protein